MKYTKKLIAFLLIFLLCLCGSGCKGPMPERFETVYYDVFDTVTKLSGYAQNKQDFLETSEMVHTLLLEYHQLFDIYHDYPNLNNLKTINDSAGGDPLKVDARIIDLLQFGLEVYTFTDHTVDITLGPVLALWHEAREIASTDPDKARIPDSGRLKEAFLHVGFSNLEINVDLQTVRLLDEDARLDVGAIAKGYVAQHVSEILPDGYLISLGGNVLVKGSKPNHEPWNIGIQDPLHSSNLLCTVKGQNVSVVTSGDYQRAFWIGDTCYHHIIDPKTLYPGEKWRSVTVIHEDSKYADALSTALFLLDLESGKSLLSRFSAEAMWVSQDGTEYRTEGFNG